MYQDLDIFPLPKARETNWTRQVRVKSVLGYVIEQKERSAALDEEIKALYNSSDMNVGAV